MTEVYSSTKVFLECKKSGIAFYVHKIYTLKKNSEKGDAFRIDVGFATPYSFCTFVIERKVEKRWTLNALFEQLSTNLMLLRGIPGNLAIEADFHSKSTTDQTQTR